MNKSLGVLAMFLLAAGFVAAAGFDEFGYNNDANIFVGTGTSWCQGKLSWDEATCSAYMAPYGNDKLVMKWNEQWDICNQAGNDDEAACAGAWNSNEWNGKVKGGSGEVWHYKTIWVGSDLEQSPYWREGGYAIWGSYEVLMDQGTADGVHDVLTHAAPNGYGRK